MKTILPVDWESLDRRVTGMYTEDAVRVVLESLVAKVNEIVERLNEL